MPTASSHRGTSDATSSPSRISRHFPDGARSGRSNQDISLRRLVLKDSNAQYAETSACFPGQRSARPVAANLQGKHGANGLSCPIRVRAAGLTPFLTDRENV